MNKHEKEDNIETDLECGGGGAHYFILMKIEIVLSSKL